MANWICHTNVSDISDGGSVGFEQSMEIADSVGQPYAAQEFGLDDGRLLAHSLAATPRLNGTETAQFVRTKMVGSGVERIGMESKRVFRNGYCIFKWYKMGYGLVIRRVHNMERYTCEFEHEFNTRPN